MYEIQWNLSPCWDEVESLCCEFSSHPYAQYALEWTYHLHQTAVDPFDFYIVQFKLNGNLRGFAVITVIADLHLANYLGRGFQRLFSFFSLIGIELLHFKVGFLETPICNLPGLFTKSDDSQSCDSSEAVNMYVDLLEDLKKQPRRFDFLAVKTTDKNENVHQRFRKMNIFSAPFFPTATLPLNYKDFREYTYAIKKSERTHRLTNNNRAARNAIKIEIWEKCECPPAVLFNLYEQTYHKVLAQGGIPLAVRPTEEFFASITSFKTKPVYIVLKKGESIIGFLLSFSLDSQTLVARYIGLNYGTFENVNGYKLLLFAAIEYAIAFGYRTLTLGVASYQTKISLGAQLSPRYYWVQFYKYRALKWLLQYTVSSRNEHIGIPNDLG